MDCVVRVHGGVYGLCGACTPVWMDLCTDCPTIKRKVHHIDNCYRYTQNDIIVISKLKTLQNP